MHLLGEGAGGQAPDALVPSATVRLSPMALYHVRVSVAGNMSVEVKLDLDYDQLQEQFLKPYELGSPIVVNGLTIKPSNLKRLRISKSEGSAWDFVPVIEAEELADGLLPIPGFRVTELQVAGRADDVTDDFIKGPPGWNAPSGSLDGDKTRVRRVTVPSGPGDGRSVFLVHGRNAHVAGAMREFLRSLDLRVIEWEQAVKLTGEPNPYIGDVITSGLGEAEGIVVLATPDDIVKLDPDLADDAEDPELIEARQPRQNVIYEAGMAMALAPTRTLIVATPGTKILSDIAGRHLAYLDNSPRARKRILGRLQTMGLSVDDSGTGWLEAGDFGDE